MNATLGSICHFLNGGTPSKDVEAYFRGDIPWITSADITGPVVDTARSFITPAAVQKSATNKVAKGTVLLVTRTGVGKVAMAGCELCFSQDITAIIPDSARLDTAYLVHFLRTKQNYFERSARGATIKGITRDVVTEASIPLPPLPEQRRIAAILDQADALRAKRREALAQLDKLAKAIFVEMFGDPGSASQKFQLQPLLSLVEGGFQNGAYFPKENYSAGGTEMVHMSDAFGGIIRRGQLKRVKCDKNEIDKYALGPADIIIARRSLTYEGAAKPCMVPSSAEPLIFESSFIRIRAKNGLVTPLYIFHYLNNERVREKFVRPYVTQSTISGINQSNLAQVPVMLPPITLQKEFGAAMAHVGKASECHKESLREMENLFTSLQHRAFRGEL